MRSAVVAVIYMPSADDAKILCALYRFVFHCASPPPRLRHPFAQENNYTKQYMQKKPKTSRIPRRIFSTAKDRVVAIHDGITDGLEDHDKSQRPNDDGFH